MIARLFATYPAARLGVALALWPMVASAAVDSIRVTTWDLQPSAAVGASGWSPSFQQSLIQEAATTLAGLNPDVILLQDIANWEACHQLAETLPGREFKVAVCSSFRDPATGALSRQQVAILSKTKPYLCWPDSWRSENGARGLSSGFAFAAIRIAGRNTGFFSAQFGDGALTGSEKFRVQREQAARQFIRQTAALGKWTTNRLEAFVGGGNFNTTRDEPLLQSEQTLPIFEAAGFANALAELPFDQRVTLPANSWRAGATVDYIFSKGTHSTLSPLISRTALAEHCAVTCEMDFSPPPMARAGASSGSATGSALPAPTNSPGAEMRLPASFFVCGIVLIIVALLIIRVRRNRQKARVGQGSSSVSLSHANAAAIAPPLPQGVVAELGRWAKQKVMQKLLSDRAQLLLTQQTAALKALELDERLSNLEQQIQQRRHEYERRIDELLKELSTAREENRELIQARIALIKIQMEEDRLKTGPSETERRRN